MNNKFLFFTSLGCVLGIVGMLLAAQKIVSNDADLKNLAKNAYIWGYPLVAMQRSKQVFTKEGQTPVNQFKRYTELITPSFTEVVTPNVDTLYAMAWLDLAEPQVLSVPDVQDRYYVVQFLDAYTNVIKNIGKRTTGTKPGTYLIVGPSWSGITPQGMTLITSPTNLVWLVTRILVKNDAPAVRDILSKITLAPFSGTCVTHYSAAPKGTLQELHKAGIRFFDELSAVLAEQPPPATQKGLVELFSSIGVGPGKQPSNEVQDAKLRTILEQAVVEGEQEIDAKITALAKEGKNGWSYNLKTGNYGDDYLLRAAMAKQGFGANVPQESLYPLSYIDSTGQTLSGKHNYVIHFDTLPPVDGFWSVTVYDKKTRLLSPNALNRYALSDRSSMDYNKDGSLDIFIQHSRPEKESNWLPVPEGEFYLVLRQYMPKQAILDNTYEYPLIKRVEAAK